MDTPRGGPNGGLAALRDVAPVGARAFTPPNGLLDAKGALRDIPSSTGRPESKDPSPTNGVLDTDGAPHEPPASNASTSRPESDNSIDMRYRARGYTLTGADGALASGQLHRDYQADSAPAPQLPGNPFATLSEDRFTMETRVMPLESLEVSSDPQGRAARTVGPFSGVPTPVAPPPAPAHPPSLFTQVSLNPSIAMR